MIIYILYNKYIEYIEFYTIVSGFNLIIIINSLWDPGSNDFNLIIKLSNYIFNIIIFINIFWGLSSMSSDVFSNNILQLYN